MKKSGSNKQKTGGKSDAGNYRIEQGAHGALSHNSGGYVLGQTAGQNAPKAKKPPVAFNEEDLADDDTENEEWMRKMEQEW